MVLPNSFQEESLLSTTAVSKELGVHRSTVWGWVRSGALQSTHKGSFHGISRENLRVFRETYGINENKPPRRKKRRKETR